LQKRKLQKITDEQLLRWQKLLQKLKNTILPARYGMGDKRLTRFYIVQTRPVTTINDQATKKEIKLYQQMQKILS